MSDLTRDVLKDFADIVIDNTNQNGEQTAYGTTVESDGVDYVKLDGSSLLTPITTTTDIKPGERVLVLIKNHQAIIIGNSSNPSAGKQELDDLNKTVNLDKATIKDLVANNVTINESLKANEGRIDNLEAVNVTIEGRLDADRADITRIDTEKLNADEADIRYAKVDELRATSADVVKLNADYAKFKDASVKRLDANEASIKKLDADKLNAADAEIKYLTVDNAKATYLQAGEFTAYKATVENLLAAKASIEELEANYIKATQIESTYAKITDLDAAKANIDTLNADLANVENLVAQKADISDLEAANAKIQTLVADLANVNTLVADKVDAKYVQAEIVKANQTITDDLKALHAVVDTLDTKYATIEQLNAAKATLENLVAQKADISDLNAAKATIGELDAQLANINSILSGNIGTGLLQTIHLTAENVVIDDAIIKSANIEDLDVSKLNAGTISTDKFLIQSDDGGILISGSTQQFKDKNNKVRLQIGKDANGEFNFIVFGEDGTTAIYNQNGITKQAVPDGLIVDKMVSDNANIQAKKVQYIDKDGNKTLQTVIEQEQGKITELIKETTIENSDGTSTSLKDKYLDTVKTVDGMKTTIADVETKQDAMSSKITEIEATSEGIKTTVTEANTNATQAKKDASDALLKAQDVVNKVNNANSTASNAQTIANQTASKFQWIVKSGSSATNFTLTDRTAQLVAENINLNGLVTFTGLDSSTQNKINLPNDTITEWSSDTIDENVTIINGGYIRVGTIDLKHLNVDNIFSTGNAVMNIINSQEINANRITSGTIVANRLSLYGMEVLQKETNMTTLNIRDSGDITMRGSVESFNYASGKAGWSIRSNGDAEFNDVIVRGSLITDDGGVVSSAVISEDAAKQVRFWAGSSYENRENAPWIVYNDGSMLAQKGSFSGVFTGDIKIGNISISDASSTSGGDALLTIQNGQNGVKVVQLRDSDHSDFAQEIHITDNFYNEKISLQQDGVGLFTSGIAIGDNTTLNDSRLILNKNELASNEYGYIFKSPEVSVGSSIQDSLLNVYGDTILNGVLHIERTINFNNIVECTVSANGIDFNFKE